MSCEPASYLASGVDAMRPAGVTTAQATCVVKATDRLALTDPHILDLMVQGTDTPDWPARQRAELKAAITPACVPARLAEAVIEL